jgi:hypothetical protein
MSVYYHYVHLSKKERFAVDSLGGGIKRSSLGRTLAGRAFHLMLENVSGRWAGDNIVIMGDDVIPDWEQITAEFIDIEANAILTVFQADGFDEIRASAAHDNGFFMQLCHMVITGQAIEMEVQLQEMCGGSYQKRYAQLCQKRTWFLPKNVVSIDS